VTLRPVTPGPVTSSKTPSLMLRNGFLRVVHEINTPIVHGMDTVANGVIGAANTVADGVKGAAEDVKHFFTNL